MESYKPMSEIIGNMIKNVDNQLNTKDYNYGASIQALSKISQTAHKYHTCARIVSEKDANLTPNPK